MANPVIVGDQLLVVDGLVDKETGEVKNLHRDTTYEHRAEELKQAEEKRAKQEKINKNSPYKDWGQLNLDPDCGKARRQLMRESPVAYQIFDFLMEKADRHNAIVCSNTVLSEALGYSEASIFRGIKILKDHKFLTIKKSGLTNVYLLNSELIWKSWGKNYQYAEFSAKVIISASEQDEQDEKPTKTTRVSIVEMK